MNTNTQNTNTSASKNGPSANFGSESGMQEKVMKQIRELGDTLERAGEKIEAKGWETIGQAIYKLGNSLEHLNEKSGSEKPEKKYTDAEFDSKSKNFSDPKTPVLKVGGNDSQAL